MHVQMENGLARSCPIVDDHPVSLQLFGASDFLDHQEQMTQKILLFLRGFRQGGDMLLRDDEDVGGCLGIDISKGYGPIVFLDDI